ncbi:MAG: PspC domain-containing protein [Sphingopyxis sp.]|nr:PspC domain-containing protein [Sphingopyxis sp.]
MTTTAANVNRNTFNRPDTFFGVCEAIGQDFGFNPLWLRLAFVPPVFFAPHYAAVAYIAMGLVVLASRLLFPAKNEAATAAATPTLVAAAPAAAPADISDERLPLAA